MSAFIQAHPVWWTLLVLGWGFGAGASAWSCYGFLNDDTKTRPVPRVAYVVVTLAILIAWFVLPVIWLFDEPDAKERDK